MRRYQRIICLFYALLLALPLFPRQAAAAPAATPGMETANQIDSVVATDKETTFRVLTTDYRMEEIVGVDGPCQQIVLAGYEAAGTAGTPQLPSRSLLLGIPPGAVPTVEILAQSADPLPGTYRLCPVADAVAEENEGDVVRYVEQPVAPDALAYGKNEFLPATPVRITENGQMGRLQFVRVEITPFQYNPATGVLIHFSQLQVRVSHSGSAVQIASGGEADAFVQSVQGLLLNGERASTWAGVPIGGMNINAVSNQGWAPPAQSLRLAVREEGIYTLGYDELARYGVPVASISSHSLRLYLNGQDVAVRVVDDNNQDDVDGIFAPTDRLLFYGQGVDEKYTDANIYWLTWGGQGAVHMLTPSQTPGSQLVDSYQASVTYEENFNYVSSAPMESGYDHWYGRLLTVAGSGVANSWRMPINISAPASGSQTASLQAAMVSRTRGTHHVKFYVNENYVGDGQWSGPTYATFAVNFDQALLIPDANWVRAEIVNDLDGQTVSVVYFDWLRLNYQRQTTAVNDRIILDIPTAGAWTLSVDGFSGSDLEAYDISDPLRVAHIPVAAARTASFGVTSTAGGRYLVQRTSQRKQVASIQTADTVDLLSSSNQADYFIIAHKDFLDAIRPLADYRAARGLKVAVIDVQHIYDTFNFGRMSPQAIRDFLLYAYTNWQTSGSSYVLLVGDGTYDPRQYRSDSAPTFIPPYLELVDPGLGETAADNRYVTILGTDHMPDMHLGRLPAESPEEVTAMVRKIIAYESEPADSGWNKNVLFVTDDLTGGGGAFYNYSNAIADGSMEIDGQTKPLLPSSYTKTKLYLPYDCATGDSCREQIVSRINQGALLVSYVGHSAKEYWAEENLLNRAAVTQMNNTAYPVMLPMTCLEGYFQEAEKGRMSLAEAMVRKANGGAIASWSSSGLGLASGHDYLERGFFIAVFHIGVRELGPATWMGKAYLYANAPKNRYDDLLDTFTLLGDPALKLRTLDSVAEPRQFDLFLPTVVRETKSGR
ncbi:MAG: C25 family cysteine peptidase [Caldilineaceae bacterium]